MRIFIAGGTGLIGSRLIPQLQSRNDQIVLLTRRPDAAREQWGGTCDVVEGDPTEQGDWMQHIADCDGVVNLTGENIFNRRWNDEFIEVMRSSRVESTRNIAKTIQENPKRDDGSPKVLVNASAIGYYGPCGDEEMTEESPPGDDVMAKICIDWEEATKPAAESEARLVILRVGVVLDRRGGALKQMITPFKMFVGGKVGSGNQWVSWIHHADLVGLILFALDNEQTSGPMNGTAPNPVRNKEFSKALGKALGRPSFMPTPKFGIRVLLGKVANVVTTGQRVLPTKAQEQGYTYQFPEVFEAMANVINE